MQKLVAGLAQIVSRRADRRRIGDIELDADLRNRPLSWPLSGPEASLGSLRQRPHTEALATADLLAVVVSIAAEALKRQTQGVDVQLSARRRVRRDHRHGRQKLNLQCSLLGSRRSANDGSRNPRASLVPSPAATLARWQQAAPAVHEEEHAPRVRVTCPA